uniref:Troponin I, cardiac muscle n=3 Tax=Canidae TaxID=9608 RepID=A0A8C0TUY8_CANLF
MTQGTPGSLEVPLEVPEPGRLCPGLRRDTPPTGLPWFLRASSSGAEVGLPEALPLTPAPHSRLSHSLEAWPPLRVQPSHARGRQKGLEARLAAGSAGGSQQGGEMGRSPGARSTPAPEGTSAVPGLIPDLISGLPWPRWALIAVAVAAGVLTVSCLLCVICCCCRRRHHGHRKKPRDREAVGLSSPQGTTTSAHLVRVGLKQATDLRAWGPGSTADPYARVSLSTQAGHRHETKVHRDTLCPMFQETCCFHVPQEELSQTTLQVQVLSFKRFSAHEPLGELSLPLGTVDLHHVLEHWYQLGPPGTVEPEAWGELCFLLQYMPSSGRLTVVVLEARGLSPGLAGSKPRTSGWGSKQKRNRAITARRQHLKSVMLQIAAQELEKEESRRESEKQNYLSEHCPPLHLPGSMSEVQELCKQLHAKIDAAEEEKYDMEVRVQKSTKELEDMNQKLFDLRGKFKRPPLRRVRMSADAMLKALLGSKHKVCMDLRANLKQVKKEDTEKERDLRDVGDWRKNIEEKSGMEGRKKMFETES